MKKHISLLLIFALSFLVIILFLSVKESKNLTNTLVSGLHPPDDFYVVIEIPAQSTPVKYEMDKGTGLLFVDRFINTDLRYPANYGYIPQTLSGDGDPTDVLVITPYPVISGAVIRARPIALLKMTDEAGTDAKIIALPIDKVYPDYAQIHSATQLDPQIIKNIEDFFQNYKNNESGKWVKIEGWEDAEAAKKEILQSLQ